ncbi:D-aminoacyl-tRNA deacylase 2-like [Portunus trituberculatus]|uniref:D-aminoacyl-tRNA deacylase 2-like n=1 Tax=Portunus trituberculatus TaxID=210409 RepID=UPI001E1D1FCD|nr:D-aminoacyl-tRNA deacylase 2-like [Portunus trituberculatus]
MEVATGKAEVGQAANGVGHMSVQQNGEVAGRMVVQQCLSASLKLERSEDEAPEIVKIGRGMVVFVCFLEKATEETVDKLSKHITNVRLCENDNGRRVSVCDVQGDVLIVPQATLGGKLKGKAMQYHMNIDKVFGEALYRKFCHQVRSSSEKVSSGNVKCGVYGTRQVLSMDTNGPYTHIIEV